MIFQVVVGKMTCDLTLRGRLSSHPLQETLLLSRVRWSDTHQSYGFYSKECLPVHRERELNLRALKMQTSNPGFGQSKTFSNLTKKKKHKTYLAIARVSCWVIGTGGGNFLEHQDLPYLSHPPYQWEKLPRTPAEQSWSGAEHFLNSPSMLITCR